MAGVREPGGILGLLELIEEHRAAVEYDFRTRFPGLPEGVYSVPEQMGWSEAIRAVRTLRADPSTQLAAAMEQWAHPFSRTEAILADVYDLEYAKAGVKKRQPYPRPWATDGATSTRKGNTAGRTRTEVLAILAAHGHALN